MIRNANCVVRSLGSFSSFIILISHFNRVLFLALDRGGGLSVASAGIFLQSRDLFHQRQMSGSDGKLRFVGRDFTV
ncbi:MAG: hypothetical protein AAF555_01930 [Verrucomicrobiota bacterium]